MSQLYFPSESPIHSYFTQFLSRDLSFTPEKSVFLVTFQQLKPGFPSTALMKVYRGSRKSEGIHEGELLKSLELRCSGGVRCYYCFEHAEEAYVFVEYCGKGSVEQWRRGKEGRKVKEGKFVQFFRQMADLLSDLHHHQIFHGSLNLNSFLITDSKELKLTGFLPSATSQYQEKDVKDLAAIMLKLAGENIDFCDLEGENTALNLLNSDYSPEFTSFLREINTNRVGNIDEMRAFMRNLPSKGGFEGVRYTCTRCEERFRECFTPKCGHILCRTCLISQILTFSGDFTVTFPCFLCNSPFDLSIFDSILSFLPLSLQIRYENYTKSRITSQCPHCGFTFPVLKLKKRGWKPYDCKCKCRHVFCSYCGLRGGHKIVVFHRKCYVFAKEIREKKDKLE